jgi:hypothetical protein
MTLEAIKALDVAPLDVPHIVIERAKSISGDPSAAINGGSVIAFVAGIKAQEQEDVLYSMQLAQRAASAVANRYREISEWYQKYTEVLELTGWVVTEFSPAEQELAEGQYEMAKAALSIIAAAATGPQTAVLAAAIKALEGMAKDDGFITLFEHFGAKGLVGNFQIGAVERGASGHLSTTLAAFQMNMAEHQKKFLFFKWRTRDIKVWAHAQSAKFNYDHYAPMREEIRQKLGRDARKAIAALPLAPLS